MPDLWAPPFFIHHGFCFQADGPGTQIPAGWSMAVPSPRLPTALDPGSCSACWRVNVPRDCGLRGRLRPGRWG